MDKECNIVELFSGIGSQAKALKNLGYSINTLGTCEWDIHAFVAYDAIHNSPEIPEKYCEMEKDAILDSLTKYSLSNDGKTKMEFSMLKTYRVDTLRRVLAAIERGNNYVDVTSLDGKSLPDGIDILTYSFPCQDLSNVGAFHGYNKGIDRESGSRSSLLWQVGRILKEMDVSGKEMPKYLLMENVPTLLSQRHKVNFDMWISELNDLGYISKYYHLNASDFGLPQNRPRLLMISVYVGMNDDKKSFVDLFLNKSSDDIVKEYKQSEYYEQKNVSDLLRIDYDNHTSWFEEAVECTPNDTVSRRTIWEENPQLVLEGNIVNPAYQVIRTITTKQDRNPNSGNIYINTGIEGRSRFRYLTPRECFLFMGFTDDDFDNVIKYNPQIHSNSNLFPRDKLIRMAGNSIPVKLLEGIFYQIKMLDSKLCEEGF